MLTFGQDKREEHEGGVVEEDSEIHCNAFVFNK